MRTQLIQRGRFEDRDYKKGIDSIVKFDYMGSSEFEYGALPESLGKIRANISEYTYLDVPMLSFPKSQMVSITVFCKNSQKAEVKTYLQELADDNFSLQEPSDFDTYINKKEYPNRTDFWWDIGNHLMFWKKNIEFEQKFRQIIENKPQ